jgi:hypothetical protein
MSVHSSFATDTALIVTIESAIAVLEMNGYKVTAPRMSRASTGPRMDAIPQHTPAMRRWVRDMAEFTFADGSVVRSYACRESVAKPHFIGSATRAACDKYRYRQELSSTRPIDMIPVPELVRVDGIPCDLDALNAATAEYRAPSANRFAAKRA